MAWVLAQGNNLVPIPGTKRVRYLEENLAATKVVLTKEDLKRLDTIAPVGAFSGTRYGAAAMRTYNFKSDAELIADSEKGTAK